MKNTGITYTSAERSPVILPEMAELLPPLSAEQLDALEADLIKNGCYSPIIVNEDMVIIDGHNRQALCEKHGLPYRAFCGQLSPPHQAVSDDDDPPLRPYRVMCYEKNQRKTHAL